MAEEQEGETDMMGPGGIRVARRRLSVVSDSPTVDGVSLALSHLGVRRGSELSDAPHVVQGDLGSSGHSIRSLAAEANVVSIYSGYSKKGMAPYNPRKKNQDALIMAEDPATNSLLLVVLDGHGEAGDKVAQAFRRELAPAVMAHPSWTTNVKVAIGDCIAKIEEGLLADPSIDTDFSGSTLVCGCIRGSLLTVANIGDSRLIIGRKVDDTRQSDGSPALVSEQVSEDHKPDGEGEKQRILQAGGRVFAVEYDDGMDGPQRVWLGHMDVPGLAMSRSVGDKVAHTAGVISTPEWFERQLVPEDGDCMIILASDGLWEFMTNEECVAMAARRSQPRDAVQDLILEANARWMKEDQVIDDTTVCVAYLGGWSGGGSGRRRSSSSYT